MSLRPELEKLLKTGAGLSSTLGLIETGNGGGAASEAGTITKADAVLIAQALKEELQSGIFERYRKNSLVFMPPLPKEASSEAYTKLYIAFLKSSIGVNEEIKIKLWILSYLEKNDPAMRGSSLREVSKRIDATYGEWESQADKKGLTLAQLVNEELSVAAV